MQHRFKQMKIWKLLVLAIFSLILISGAAAEWYKTDWNYRKEITFNQSQISGSNEDFPALINITDTDLKEKAQNDGDDILFTSSNGSYRLDHEIEVYNNSNGRLTAHVKILNMTNQSQTSIYMYYGNSGASNQENVSGVWSNGFEAVYHLDEEKTGTGNNGVYEDSTSNNNDGDDEVSDSGNDGVIYQGQNFDSSDDYIDLGFEYVVADETFTISTWFHVDSTQYSTLVDTYDGSFPQVSIQYNEGQTGLDYRLNDGSELLKTSAGILQKNVTYHVTGIRDGADSVLYLNGKEKDSDSKASLASDLTGSGNLRAGRRPDGTAPLDGFMDELRISSVARTDNWLATSYKNQENPSSFYKVGSQEREKASTRYARTFINGTDKPRSFFAKNTVATIKTDGKFSSTPRVTITDSNGDTRVIDQSMTNVSGVFEYNFTVNQSNGWYDVKINGNTWENVFYQSPVWEDNFTDTDGNVFSFRRKLNVSEPNVNDRWFVPVDRNLDFTFSPDNDSIRVVAWNGSAMLEIPSQIYNVTKSGEAVSNANVVFLSSLNRSENRTYYVMSSKSEFSKSYSGINYTDTGLDNKTENAYFRTYFNRSLGGLMRDTESKVGTGDSLGGSEPMDFYPELKVGLSTLRASEDNTPNISVSAGPLLTEVSVSGNVSKVGSKPYTVDCSVYAANPYMICEKNVTAENSETWSNFYLNGLIGSDGKFSYISYDNSSDDIVTRSLTDGDGTDFTSLDSDMKWISLYNNNTGDSIAELYLEKDFGPTESPAFQIFDDSVNDYFRQRVISSGTSVSSGDSYYTKTARVFYNGLRGAEFPNKLYNRLKNPVNLSEGVEVTNDNSAANYSSKGNVSSNDSSSAKVFSYWSDDTFLDYAEINITGNGVNGSNTELYYNDSYEIRDSGGFTNNSWVNVTLSNSTVNAGEVSANITVFDVSGKSNSTLVEFNVSDSTPPEYSNIVNDPNNTADLDPGNQVNITANITEYSNVSQAFLYYKNDSAINFSRKSMSRESETDYVHKYKSNFTPGYEDNYSYFVSANDTLDQVRNSSRNNLTVEWDYTWNFDPNLDGQTDTFNKNVSIGNLTINNTGDFNQTFRFSTGVLNSRTWVNGTRLPARFEVSGNGSTEFFSVNATTRDSGGGTEGVDTFNLTVENSSASPELNFSSFDVTTSTGGPFLATEIKEYNSTVTQGDLGQGLTAEVTNKGNESATTVNITFNIPSEWSVSSGESLTSNNDLNLAVGTSKTFSTKVDIPSNASTGTKTLEAVVRSEEDNRSTSFSVTVESKDSGGNDNDDPVSESSGGGGGGGGAGGAGDTGLSSNQQQKLFQTEETYEIVRGEDQEFTLTVENPFQEGELENVRVNVSGFLSQYLSVEPSRIDEIKVNSSANFSINVEAPRYFSRGKYSLNFNISGINNRSEVLEINNNTVLVGDTPKFTENRNVDLVVHEIPESEAQKALNESVNAVEDLNESGFLDRETVSLIDEAEAALEDGNYQRARSLSQQVKERGEQAESAQETLSKVESLLERAERRGLNSPRTERMVSMAEAALERGDYSTAASRAQEAKNTYALETKGEINYLNYAKRNWKKLGLGLILFIGFSTGGFLRFRLFRINRKLSKLEEEEKTLLGLMKQVQRESFEEGKMSMEEYEEAMMQYEKQLSQNVKETIRMETRKNNWKRIRTGKKTLEKERDRIQELMKETQKKYLDEGEIETRIYKQKMQSFRERLTELEGKLAEMEAQKQIKQNTGLQSYLPETLAPKLGDR